MSTIEVNTACKSKKCEKKGVKPGVVCNPAYKRGLNAWTVNGVCATCGNKFHAFISNVMAESLGLVLPPAADDQEEAIVEAAPAELEPSADAFQTQ